MTRDKTIPELKQAHTEAFEAFRAQESRFELCRADVRAQRERLNRIRKLREENETAANAARAECRSEMQATDGEMTDAMKEKRRSFRDAENAAEDYRDLESEALKALERVEIPALRAAREMRGAQVKALHSLVALELRALTAEVAPKLARVARLRSAALHSDPMYGHNGTIIEDPINAVMRALESAAKAIDPDTIEMPADLIERGDIAPLSWSDAHGAISQINRAKAAGVELTEPAAADGEELAVSSTAAGRLRDDAKAAAQDAAQLANATGMTDPQTEAEREQRAALRTAREGMQRQMEANRKAADAMVGGK